MTSTASCPHVPVMLREVVDALAPRDGGIYVDGTFGRGGYATAILEAAQTHVIGIDRDPDAIEAGQALVARFSPRLELIHGTFGSMASFARACVDGIALDLGVSSPQLDCAERGFSFRDDGPLDMRMSLQGPSAADIVNTTEEKLLADIIFTFGQERYARRIARTIVQARKETPFTRTRQLAELVRRCVPRANDGLDPATRTFQALRIAVNDELDELTRGLCAAENLLKPGGKLAVVSFHSLEDACVKNFLRARSASAPRNSRHAPARHDEEKAPTFVLASRKPQTPSQNEIAANARACSARLRVAERNEAPPPAVESVR